MGHYKDHIQKKRTIIAKYNSTSAFYNKRYHEIQQEKYAYFLNHLEYVPKLSLDAGCGTGLLLAKFLDEKNGLIRNSFYYVGVDISLNMLKFFKASLKDRKRKEKCEIILADLEYLPLRNDKFDSLFTITSLQNLYDMQKGVLELIRTSKTEAILHISVLKKQLDKQKLISILKSHCRILRIEDSKNIEDLLIWCSVKKK